MAGDVAVRLAKAWGGKRFARTRSRASAGRHFQVFRVCIEVRKGESGRIVTEKAESLMRVGEECCDEKDTIESKGEAVK